MSTETTSKPAPHANRNGLQAQLFNLGQIAIFGRKRDIIQNRIHPAVKAAGLEVFNLETDDSPPANRVAIGTMHRSKGLQFRAVAIVGVEEGTVPLNSVRVKKPDEAAQRAFVETERNLLYVACSRARERLLVTAVGKTSEFLPSKQQTDAMVARNVIHGVGAEN